MKNIYILKDLNLTQSGLCANEEYVFLQQGSLDGACGPYCLFMGLLILGEVDNLQTTNLETVKGSSRLGKMLKKMANLEVLIHNGTTTKELTDILDNGFKKRVGYNKSHKQRNRDLVQFIVAELAQNKPVLVTIRNESINFAHWLLAIGYQTNNEGAPTEIYFLDPSSREMTHNQYWNMTVKIANNYRKKHSHELLDGDENNVLIDDCFSIFKKN